MSKDHLWIPLDVCRITIDGFRNTKINKLQKTFDKKEIRWLQIRVHNAFLMNGVHSFKYLLQNVSTK